MNKEITSPKCCHEICYFPVIGVTGPTGATGSIGPARKCNAISVSLVNSRSSTVYPSETIVFDTLINKTNNNIVYDFESGEFTFLSSGYYIVYFTLNVNPSTLAVDFKINFTLNNSQIITAAGAGSNSGTPTSLVTTQSLINVEASNSIAKLQYIASDAILLGDTAAQGCITIFSIS